jgi:hypothetical protein
MLKRFPPCDLAFGGVLAVEDADDMAAPLEFGCRGEDICLRPAECAKFFVNEQYSHASVLLSTTGAL